MSDESRIELSELWAVLDGSSSPSFESRVGRLKMLKIALDLGPADLTVRADRFWIATRAHGRSRYVLHAALPVVSELMQRAGVASVRESLVAGMPSEEVAPGARAWSFRAPDYVVWFLRREDGLDIQTRVPGPAGLPPEPRPVPDDGPFAAPDPWFPHVWSPPASSELVYRSHPGGCPHCGGASARFRELSRGSLVCASCGRSFVP